MSRKIKELRKDRGLTLEQVADIVGVGKSTVRKWETGMIANMRRDKIADLAKALKTTPAYLMGWEEKDSGALESDMESYGLFGIRPITKKRFPMLGEIACGKPIFAEEDHESYVDSLSDIDADFCLTAKGDSMIGAGIHDGDIVFIKKQPIVNNGEIAAVIIGDEATLKVWYFDNEKKKLVLNPANQSYEPLVYIGAELDTIMCLGKAVCYMSKL